MWQWWEDMNWTQHLAFIPARGGSKIIPGKNLVQLAGKPLIQWSIEAAQKSTYINRIIVGTDDLAISCQASDLGVEVMELPVEITQDNVHASNALFYALRKLQTDTVMMLLPTSPLRREQHIDAAYAKLLQLGDERPYSIISVTLWAKHMIHLRRLKNKTLQPLWEGLDLMYESMGQLNRVRQGLEPLYVLNGAINLATPATLWEYMGFHNPFSHPLIMSTADSADVNSYEDLELAEFYVAKRAMHLPP